MKPASRIILLTIFLAIVTVACVRTREQKLLEVAETVMEEHPDSALAILADSIAMPGLKTEKDSARYALLLTQAMVKTDTPVTSDSLIHFAENCFSDDSKSENYMKSLYYSAYLRFTQGSLASAIYPATKAYDIASFINDYYWIAKTADLLSDILSYSYNVNETEKFITRSAVFYDLAGKKRHHLFAMCNLAISRGNSGKREGALMTIDSILNIARHAPVDSGLVADCLSAKVNLYIALNKPADAISALLELKYFDSKYYNWRPEDESYLFLAKEMMSDDTTASDSNFQIDNADTMQLSGQGAYYYAKSLHFRNLGDLAQAMKYTDSLNLAQNELIANLTNEYIISGQRDYYNEKSLEERRWADTMKWITIAGAIIFVIIISCLCAIYHFAIKSRRMREEQLMRNIEELSVTIESQDEEKKSLMTTISEKEKSLDSVRKEWEMQHAKMKSVTKELVKGQWKTFNMLCDEYFEKYESEKLRKEIASNIYKEIKKIKSKSNLKNIENMVNTYMDDIVVDLRKQCKFLSEDDISFITLLFAGFSARSVCMTMDLGYKNFYQKRYRLKERISASEAQDKDRFIAYIF